MNEPKRRCRACPTLLSIYNDDILCAPCRARQRDDERETLRYEVLMHVQPRKAGRTALARAGYQRTMAWLLETRERLVLRDGESEVTAAFDTVIAVCQVEARKR